MSEALFWLAAALVAYVYVGYPLLLLVWSRLAPRPVHPSLGEPPVSVIVAVRDEAEALERKIANLRSLDYPASRLQIVIVADGGHPATTEVMRRWASQVTTVYVRRGGKARALNAGVEAARHDILVFADVRQRFDRQALRGLVAPLADPTVGGVSGELFLDAATPEGERSDIGEGIGGYWKYEKWLRRHESMVGSTMGATGAIYALRRSLWRPLPAETILDDVLAPMRAVLAASRVVFASDARAFDPIAPSGVELQRKIRTLAGNYQILRLEPRLLNPFGNPVWLQYMSHKVGRLLVPWALVVVFASSASLAPESAFYALAFAAQVAFYGLAAYGAHLSRRDRKHAEAAEADSTAAAVVDRIIKGTTP
jgi:cellulose synthase/poly-beta-1,6-N-acetylglucosamine synthase-like glycosyltransferase